jgi:thiol:disulfide interchange protein DsbC
MFVLRVLCILAFAMPLLHAQAAEGDAARAAIQKIAPLQKVSGFRKSALPGYFEGVIAGQVAYASADGRYLVRGSVEDVEKGVSLSDASMAAKRRDMLASLGADSRLTFAPAQPRYRVTVFTDVDCPYCRRLHSHVNDYNALGIAIDYVFFPLSIHVDADKKSVAVWCSPDRNEAYAAAIAGRPPERKTCANPLARTLQAGNEIGVTSTPTAIAPDGSVIAAAILMSPQRLLSELRKISAPVDPSALADSAAGR